MGKFIRQQYLSTKKVVCGRDQDKSWAPDIQHGVKAYLAIEQQHPGCGYCGFFGFGQEIDSLNDNHADVMPDNLAPVDHLCHAWHHLGELETGQALMVYLPGLEPADVVHLQRTIFIALQTGTKDQRAQAKSLLNWLVSHNRYVKEIWGSDQPMHFGLAMTANNIDPLERQYGALHDMALVVNPLSVSDLVSHWAVEGHRAVPRDEWETRALEIMNAVL